MLPICGVRPYMAGSFDYQNLMIDGASIGHVISLYRHEANLDYLCKLHTVELLSGSAPNSIAGARASYP